MGQPTVFPHGVTCYNPEKCWNGYTVVPLADNTVLLFDMNGKEVHKWNVQAMPPNLLPGGHLLATGGTQNPVPGMHDAEYVIQVDYDGNIVWHTNRGDQATLPDGTTRWMARQHHDFQREGSPVGYYVPGQSPKISGGTTLILSHENTNRPEISHHTLLDDKIVEVDWEGNLVWEWRPADHFAEFGFSDVAKEAVCNSPNADHGGDYLHFNCASYLGPNHWYDAGDSRFHPDNIIMGSRESGVMIIVDKATGNIAWRMGPNFMEDEALKKIGNIIGQHHVHMIPQGLPGAGNILLFDNGGGSIYGAVTADAPRGQRTAKRDYSRVLEIDPTTFELVWSFTPDHLGGEMPLDGPWFYSQYISSAQRLPNGNTLINEGADGRVFEVTVDHEIVWEWISPYYGADHHGINNRIYRAYRYPYDYIPQEPTPVEVAIPHLDKVTYRVPGSAPHGGATVAEVGLIADLP